MPHAIEERRTREKDDSRAEVIPPDRIRRRPLKDSLVTIDYRHFECLGLTLPRDGRTP